MYMSSVIGCIGFMCRLATLLPQDISNLGSSHHRTGTDHMLCMDSDWDLAHDVRCVVSDRGSNGHVGTTA